MKTETLETWKQQALDAVDFRFYGMTGAAPEDGTPEHAAWNAKVLAELRLTGQQRKYLYDLQLRARAENKDNAGDVWRESLGAVERCGVPHATVRAARNPNNTPGITAVKTWWRTGRTAAPCLLLLGKTGTGKSVAAAHVAMQYASTSRWWRDSATGSNRDPLLWLYCRDWATTGFDSQRDDWQQATRVKVLVLDDVPETLPAHAATALSGLIAQRIDDSTLTVVTSNAAPEPLRQMLGAATVDRIRTRGKTITCVGPSLRGEK